MSLGFLRWMFKDVHKSVSLYGTLVSLIGLIAVVNGCPQPIPFLLIVGGIVTNLCDALYSFFCYQKCIYELEQNRIVRNLKQTSNGN